MTENNEEMPIVFKTNLERLQHKTKLRQAALRAKRHAEGYVEVSMWLKVKTLDRLQIMKGESSLTQGQIIDQLINS